MKADPKSHARPTVPVPGRITEALEQSTEDLARDRIEDSSVFLKRMEARIDRYKSRRRQLTGATAGPKDHPDRR